MDELASQSIDLCISEFEKDTNKTKLKQHILNPIIKYIGNEIWPYIVFTTALLVFLFILLIIILYYIIKVKNVNSTFNVYSASLTE
jgi:hypothetical protein